MVALLLNGYMGHITNQRILCSLGGLVAALVGTVLIVALPETNNVGRLIGYYLTQASPTAFVALLAMVSSNVAGYTKKTTVAALYLIGYCAGNIIGIYTTKPMITTVAANTLIRSPNLPTRRCTALYPRHHLHRCLLWPVYLYHAVYLVVVSAREQAQECHPGTTRLCPSGEPGVVGLNGSRESGFPVFALMS